MALLFSLVALFGRFGGKVLTKTLDWAGALLFGRVAGARHVVLTAMSLASIAWLVTALGVALPDLGTWLLVALTIYFVNLGLAFFIQRPNLRRLVGVTAAADDRVWKERAKRQRYVSYLMAGLVGAIGFLMSTKPVLW